MRGDYRGENPYAILGFKPIESLRIGDFVLGHDGKPHRVLKTVYRRYRGRMVGIRIEKQHQMLVLTEDHRILTRRSVQRLSKDGAWSDIPRGHFERVRDLRNEATFPERKLWKYLSGKKDGLKFRRQHPIGPYIADFYSRQAGLVVEIDGNFAHSTDEQIQYDRIRNDYMTVLGLNVLRISAKDKQWKFVKNIKTGDTVYFGPEMKAVPVALIEYFESEEDVFDIEAEGSHSVITDVCAVHDCGFS